MHALIFNGQIVQLAAADFPVHPSMQWKPAPADATMETHIFDGVSVVLKPAKTQAEIDAEQTASAKAALVALDMASIRALREWVAAQPSAPAQIVQYEAQAAVERAKIKP